MKKILITLLLALFMVGCSNNSSPEAEVPLHKVYKELPEKDGYVIVRVAADTFEKEELKVIVNEIAKKYDKYDCVKLYIDEDVDGQNLMSAKLVLTDKAAKENEQEKGTMKFKFNEELVKD